MKTINICCIGAGFVGGPTMAVIALKCPHIKITVVDINKEKINLWNGDCKELPIFEPGLPEIIQTVRGKNLFFSTEVESAIKKSEIIFLAVNTPTKTEGDGKGYASNLDYIKKSVEQIAKVSKSNKIIIEKSTVPVKTASMIKEILDSNKNKDVEFEIISNPEFLAEGSAINDLLDPDRVLIGSHDNLRGQQASKKIQDIYLNWVSSEKIITTNIWSSELSKLVANAMLAQRISSINSISSLCEKTGANIEEISKAIGMDSRIGPEFLKVSVGFGGSCFKKDILNLVYISRYYGLDKVADYWEKVIEINQFQTKRFANRIIDELTHDNKKRVSVLGWSFKKNTNDSRESASIYLTYELLLKGFEVNVYDPMCSEEKIYADLSELIEKNNKIHNKYLKNIRVYKDMYESINGTDIVALSTEWDEFIDIDWNLVHRSSKGLIKIFDGRNILDTDKLKEIGFKIFSIGK
jgi:UDPglucose 6-dehydrogenase